MGMLQKPAFLRHPFIENDFFKCVLKYVPETYPQNTFEDMFYERKDLHYENKRYTGRGQTNPFI